MAKPTTPASKASRPRWMVEPINPVRHDVLPATCHTCHDTRKVTDPFNSSIKRPCPAC